jgi:hypothetical protein
MKLLRAGNGGLLGDQTRGRRINDSGNAHCLCRCKDCRRLGRKLGTKGQRGYTNEYERCGVLQLMGWAGLKYRSHLVRVRVAPAGFMVHRTHRPIAAVRHFRTQDRGWSSGKSRQQSEHGQQRNGPFCHSKGVPVIVAQGSTGVNSVPASTSAPGRIVPDCYAAKAGGDLTPIYAADIPIAWPNLI